MLAPGEVQSIEAALGDLARACDAADKAAADASPWWLYVVPASSLDGGAASARAYADGLRATFRRYTAERDALVERPDFDHERALALVEAIRRAAGSVAVVQDYAHAVQSLPTGAVSDVAVDAASGLAGGDTTTGVGAWASLFGFFARHPFAVLAVVALVVAGPTLAALAPAVARKVGK